MAVTGFLVLAALGLIFVLGALAGAYVSAGFSGRIEWVHFILFGGIGGALLYAAFTHCPFAITLIGQP